MFFRVENDNRHEPAMAVANQAGPDQEIGVAELVAVLKEHRAAIIQLKAEIEALKAGFGGAKHLDQHEPIGFVIEGN